MKRLIVILFLLLFLIPTPILWAGSVNDYPDNDGIVTAEDSLIGLNNKADPGWLMNQFTFATILTWIQSNAVTAVIATGDNDPGVDDDSDTTNGSPKTVTPEVTGYELGDCFINNTASPVKFWVCVDNTDGAADWDLLNPGQGTTSGQGIQID